MTAARGFLAAAACALLAVGAPAAARAQGPAAQFMPEIRARVKPVLTIDELKFRDLNGDGKLDPYEDRRLPAEARADDLVGRMTLDEKAGMMLIHTLNPGFGGAFLPGVLFYDADNYNTSGLPNFL